MKPKTIIISEKQLNKIKDTIDKDNHKGCLMIRYDLPIMKKIQAKIKSEDLYVNEEEDINGFPNHIHITVLYGLHKKYRSIYGLLGMAEHQYNIDDCQALFTDISFFENNEKYDVMILDVISPELENLNYILRTRCEYQNDYPDYHPHCTIAYLKKGCADKYRDLRLEEPVLGKPVEWLYSFDRNIIDTDNRLHETKTFMRIRGEIDWKEKFLYEFVNRSIGIGKTKHLIGQEFQNKDNPDCDFYNRLTTADGKTNIIQIEFKHDEINIIDNIISRLDAYGWFPNDKDYMKQINSLKNKGEKSIYITFEPKYDIEITGKIGTQSLYHVTPTINWLGKISKIGLCPKSQCKKALHPERVYIFPNEELKDGVSTFLSGELYKAKKQLKSKHGKDERGVMYSVLQISMQGVDHFDKRFFKDSYSKGYWTKDNISPEWIKEISRYTIDNDGSFKLLQGVNLFENTMKTKKIIPKIDENVEYKTFNLLIENAESKNIKRAIQLVLKHKGLNDNAITHTMNERGEVFNDAQAIVTQGVVGKVPNARALHKAYYLPGITRMFLNKEIDNMNARKIDGVIKLFAGHENDPEFDAYLSKWNADDLIERFATHIQQDIEKTRANIKQKQYNNDGSYNGYEIVSIRSGEEASEYSKYVSWCITQDKMAYSNYTNNGIGLFYFLLKYGYQKVSQQEGDNHPLDEYGLSMIAVSVDMFGDLVTCTSRWNCGDKIMNEEQISDLIDTGFYDIFKPRPREEILSKMNFERDGLSIQKRGEIYGLMNKNFEWVLPPKYNDINSIDKNGFRIIGIEKIFFKLYGAINQNFIEVLPPKYEEISRPDEDGLRKVILNRCYGLINQNFIEVLPPIYEEISDPDEDGIRKIISKNKTGKIGEYNSYINKINWVEDVDSWNKWKKSDEEQEKSLNCIFGPRSPFDENIFRKPKTIIISEKQLVKIKDKILTEEKEEVTFYQFKGEFQEFLKSLLEHPITCNVSSFWTSRGFSKKKMIEYLVKVGILEKEEKVNTDSIDGPQLEVSYKVLKSGFERKIKRMFIKLFEGETKDSTKLLVESINENIRYEDIDPSQINLQSFQPKSELNPRFFPDGEELLKRTRLRLLEVADDFIDELDLPFAEHKDIHIVGSIVGYNWSKYSDVDLHIIYDFDEIDKRTHFVREYMDSKKNIWNETKKIRIYGYDVELYVENIHEPAESNGRYSLESNLWVQKPVIPEPITYQKEFIKEKSAKFINLIDQYVKDFEQFTDEKNDSKLLLLSKNCNKLWSKIKGMRKVGIERGAEQDPLNIIFKVLRRAESLKKLYDLKNQLYIYNKSIR